MKSLEDFKKILLEEEKSDYSKFDMLVRAGLANKAQIQRIHKILDKMGEEKPNFSPADRMIVQNLFNKMVDLITNNKQIFQQTRRAVREDIVDTSDFKIDKTGRKYKAHRIKIGDTPAADGSVELAKEEVVQLTDAQDLDIYVFQANNPNPLSVQTVSYTTPYKMVEFAVDPIVFGSELTTNEYIIGYYESDLVGRAIKRDIDLSSSVFM